MCSSVRCCVYLFFFFKQKTAYELRISDWSSDVCSSDLDDARRPSFTIRRAGDPHVAVRFAGIPLGHEFTSLVLALLQVGRHPPKTAPEVIEQIAALAGAYHFEKIGRASCRERVCQYV